jgi:hypothetical protein
MMLARKSIRCCQSSARVDVGLSAKGRVFYAPADLILDYYHAIQAGLPAPAGELGATYAILSIYVPVLMITHLVAFYFLARPPVRANV